MTIPRSSKSGKSILAMATERDSFASSESLSGSEALSSGAPASLALGGYGVLWITRPTVLDRIATWGAGRRARSQATDVDRRLAIGAATALAETVQRARTGSQIPWERTFRVDIGELGQRMGVSLAEVTTGLDWLVRTGTAVAQGGEGQLLIPEKLWTPAPALATIVWPEVRDHLRDQGGRLAPALAVLRALADRPEAIRAAADEGSSTDHWARSGAWGKTSVAQLVNATLFGRSAVLDALGRLEATGLITRRRWPGSHGGDEVQLMPLAFGLSGPTGVQPRVGSAGESTVAPAAPVSQERRVHEPPMPVSTAAAGAVPKGKEPVKQGAQQLVQMTVAGITLCVPLGTTITVGVDDAGHRLIHVGNDIVIGPL